MRHRRYKAITRGKDPVKHGSSLTDNTGAGVGSFFNHLIFRTTVGGRITSGGVQTVRQSATTEEFLQVGDIVKYVNICLQCCPRGASPTNDNDNCAWLEWAVIWSEETNIVPTVANIGVLNLGIICQHVYRENCIMTGCFPIGTKQAMSQDIKIKLPVKACKIKMGAQLRILCYVRTSVTTDPRTDSHRLIASSFFKGYS